MPVEPIKSFDEFKSLINSGQVVVIDFWATWCGPCRAISPILESLSGQYTGIQYRKVDVDEQEAISQEVGIRAMPTFMVFKDGAKVGEVIGAKPGELKGLVEKAHDLVG